MALETQDAHTFKTFPEFSKLTLADKEAYEELIANYPPIADISFGELINWWDAFDSLAIASLNGNLVISYWLPGIEKLSGLSLVGTRKIDQSLCAIFDYQKERGEPPQVVNVPEFVVSSVRFPELFVFTEQRALNEYVFSFEKFYPLEHMVGHRRWAVKRFLANVGEENIQLKSIDLSASANKQLLLQKVRQWHGKGAVNTTFALERDAIRSAIAQGESIGLENICLFVGGELHGFCLYQLATDPSYTLLSHARIGREIPHTFNYALHAFAEWFLSQGITFVNMHSDLGMLDMRMIKLAMGPVNFFRKYKIEPAR